MARKKSQPENPPPAAPGDQEVSLEGLSAAFAEMLGESPMLHPPLPEDEEAPSEPQAEDDYSDEAVESRRTQVTPLGILEAMLFVGNPDNRPLEAGEVAGLIRGVEPDEVDDMIRQLNERYLAEGCAYEITSEGAGYRMTLRPQLQSVRDRFYGRIKETKLSQAAVEVLAIVAYNEPLTAADVNKLRGNSSGAILTQLVRRRLLRIERPEEKPRTPHYFTTGRFLELFGLESLDDLPRTQDVDRW